ncbi:MULTISPECIES: hypothetical protein [unclassified Paenibacillus]|uniref:hypothetical protein n=1 Tax=unclassified Paenibacillus TaxID=185978 RepID=UPI0036350BDE
MIVKRRFELEISEWGNRQLNKKGSEKETRHYVFDLKKSGLHYEVGDALGVWPTNCPEQVQKILAAIKVNASVRVNVKEHQQTQLASWHD